MSITGQPPGPAAHIMVIESEFLARKRMILWLRKWGYQVLAAESTTAALTAAVAGWTPDVILAACPPGGRLTGIQTIEDVRRRFGRPITAIILAAHDTHPRHLQAVRRHGCLLLPRPVRPARLQAALRYCLLPRRSH